MDDDLRDEWGEAVLERPMECAPAEEAGGEADQELLRPDAASLLRYLENTPVWLRISRENVERRLQVRSQALGEAVDLERLDKVARYETHLDRKLGRTLATLLKLQEMRRTITASAA